MNSDRRSPKSVPFLTGYAAASLLLAAGLVGCPEAKSDPEDAFRKFLADVHGRRAEAVWSELSESTQKELLARHRALEAATRRDAGHEVDPAPSTLVFEELGLMELAAPESIAVVSPPGPQVTIRVSVKDGRSAEVRMVHEGQLWKVDLMSALKKAPPLDSELRGQPVPTSTPGAGHDEP